VSDHPHDAHTPPASRFDLTFLATLLAVVLASLVFLWLADGVAGGESWHTDRAILRALRQADDPAQVIGPSWVAPCVRDLTSLGSGSVLTLVTLIVAGDLLLTGRRRAAGLTVASISLGAMLNPLLKLVFDRPRPVVVPHLVEATSSSFPSGHSMSSAIVYLTLGALVATQSASRTRGLYALGVASLLTALVGASRVVLGVHYPSDVLAGWAAGLIWAIASDAVTRRLQRSGAVESPPDDEGS
jgi:undecaprenyl-diphosphatase